MLSQGWYALLVALNGLVVILEFYYLKTELGQVLMVLSFSNLVMALGGLGATIKNK